MGLVRPTYSRAVFGPVPDVVVWHLVVLGRLPGAQLGLLVVGPESARCVLVAVVRAGLLVGAVVVDLGGVGHVRGGVDGLALDGTVVPGDWKGRTEHN